LFAKHVLLASTMPENHVAVRNNENNLST